MQDLHLITVGVCTYRRPQLLQQTLQSLSRQRTRFPFEVVVVDNDHARSAEPIVQQNQDAFGPRGHRLRYAVEEQQNISLARNKVIALAEGSFLALIDDDEIATEGWLEQLISRVLETGADAGVGPVLALVPADFPCWMRTDELFSSRLDGRPIATFLHRNFGYSGNCCFSKKAMQLRSVPFDPAYGHMGGEDTEFFFFLQKRGVKIIWCEDAIVSEYIAADRRNWMWHFIREYRVGWTYAKIMRDHEAGVKGRLEPILRAVLGTGLGVLRYLCRAHRGQAAIFLLMRDVSRQIGRLGYWLGITVRPYVAS